MNKVYKIVFLIFVLCGFSLQAQEFTGPLRGRINYYNYPQQKTVSQNTVAKLLVTSDTIPFFDDFSYAPLTPFPTINHWIDSSVYVNVGMAIAPPSIGVATFDGLNKNGYPYNIAATNIVSAAADYLTSRPINLYTKGSFTFQPSDSIALSFFYEKAGFGENPEVNDSLVLEFFKPLAPGTGTVTGTWNMVWASRGSNTFTPNDSTLKKAMVMITDTAYFHDGFQFRIRNKATTSGSLDIWNVDYVYLNKGRTLLADSIANVYNDVAFAYVPRPFLKNYSAMPFKQFTPTEMGTQFSNFIRNNENSVTPKNVLYNYSIYDKANTLLNTYPGGAGNVCYFKTCGYDQVAGHRNPAINYTFVPTDTTFFKIVHSLNAGADACQFNDTVIQIQTLSNYYAYDDGTAERGYYLNVNGSKEALRFTLNFPDTLQAMDIFFDPIEEGNLIQNSSFRMFVWSNSAGVPGTVLMMDSAMLPKYLQDGYNKIPRYALTKPLILGPGTYFFGIKQALAQKMNIGFDKNTDHHNALFYDIGSGWQPSAVIGSLMIHPIFGRNEYAVGIKENKNNLVESSIKVYPNPANDILNISTTKENLNNDLSIEIYNTLGEKIIQTNLQERFIQINTSELASGIYFVALKQKGLILSQQKLIISR